MKISRKTFLHIWLVLFIILLLPFYPYKLPDIFDRTSDNNIRLEVRHCESTGSMEILEGKDIAKKYIKQNKYKNVSADSVVLTGKTPYEELSCFRLETPKYTDFIIYGQFQKPDKQGKLNFKVEDWYVMGQDGSSKLVLLIDSELWYNNSKMFKTILLVDLIILVILTIYLIVKYFRKPQKTMKVSLKDYGERELDLLLGGMRRGDRGQEERQREHQGHRRNSLERYYER